MVVDEPLPLPDGFFVVVFDVELEEPVDESLEEPVEPVEPVDVELPLFEPDPEPIDEPLPVLPLPIDESVDVDEPIVEPFGDVLPVDDAGAEDAGIAVEPVDGDALLGSFIVPDVFCVSGVFGGSLPPHATRPAKHAPTNRAEIFMN